MLTVHATVILVKFELSRYMVRSQSLTKSAN